MASALKDCGHAAKRLREPDTSNPYPGSEAQSHVRPPRHAVTTQTALKTSENAVKTFQGPKIANVSPHHYKQPHIPQPHNQNIMKKTSYEKVEPSSSSEDASSAPLIRVTKVACVERVRTTLPTFPTEIILIIVQYLPPSSLMSLSSKFRNTRNKTGIFVEYLHGKRDRKAQLLGFPLKTYIPKLLFSDGGITLSLSITMRKICFQND